jgi:hypothetical protein
MEKLFELFHIRVALIVGPVSGKIWRRKMAALILFLSPILLAHFTVGRPQRRRDLSATRKI